MKNCPFCKGTDLVVLPDKSEDEPTRIYAYHVMCRDCHCHGRNHYPIGWCETKEAAIEAWNDRRLRRKSRRSSSLHPTPDQQ